MTRHVIAHRRAGSSRATAEHPPLSETLQEHLSDRATVLTSSTEEGRRHAIHFEADPEHVRAVRDALPDHVIVEEEIIFDHGKVASQAPGAPVSGARAPGADPAGTAVGEARSVEVRVTGAGNGLAGAAVQAVLVGSGGVPRSENYVTDAQGRVTVTIDAPTTMLGAVVVEPAGDFWSMVTTSQDATVEIACPGLTGTGPIAWWHRAVGVDTREASAGGGGIRVGVVDSGVGPNPALAHVTDLGALIGGTLDPAAGADTGQHGTVICGLIGARPAAADALVGIATGAEILSVRVFPADGGANQVDVALAIDLMAEAHQVDLINLSLASPVPSEIQRDAIQAALERGTLCVCAAGNTGIQVAYPAAFPESVAVAVLGKQDWGPEGSVAASLVPDDKSRFGIGGMYSPMFANHGAGLTCATPGVGVVSTFPDAAGLVGAYGDMSGTSAAAAVATAVLTSILGNDKEYQAMPRTSERAEHARSRIIAACRQIGLPVELTGNGLPGISSSS